MTLEASVSNVVELLERQNTSRNTSYSLERHYDAQTFAAGIAASGLADVVSTGLDRVEASLRESIFGAAVTIGVGLTDIARGVGDSNRLLRGIEEVLRTPLGTAARERYDRGVRAYERGWLPEAETEFRAALADDPYLAIAHLMLALTILRTPNRVLDAVEPFEKAIRYGTPDEPALAVGAALLLARLHADNGDTAEALAVATRAHQEYPSCAELGLLRVQVGDAASILASSILIAPELASVAMLRTPAELERAAVDGCFASTLELAADFRRLVGLVAAVPFTSCGPLGQLVAPSPAPSELDAVLEAADLLVRGPELLNVARRKSDESLRAASSAAEDEHRAELEALESGTLSHLREQVASLKGQIASRERTALDLTNDHGRTWRKGREQEIAKLLGRAHWTGDFTKEMEKHFPQLEYALGRLRAGERAFTGHVEKLTAAELEAKLTRARQLLDQLPADSAQELRDREARIDSINAEAGTLRNMVSQLAAEIDRILSEPRERHQRRLDDIAASRTRAQDLLSEMSTLLARALPTDRILPLGRDH